MAFSVSDFSLSIVGISLIHGFGFKLLLLYTPSSPRLEFQADDWEEFQSGIDARVWASDELRG